jgi:hypothetical protein
MSVKMDAEVLLTLKQFNHRYPWPSESAMRSYIYRAEELGLSNAFVRVRRRVLIDPQKFFHLIKKIECRSKQGGINEATKPQSGRGIA